MTEEDYKRGVDGLYRAANGFVYMYDTAQYIQRHQYDPKFIIANGEVIELRYIDACNGCWADANGTIFALANDIASVDDIVRCGVGWFSFPESSVLTPFCGYHDYAYSSKVYQYFHNRSEADKLLEENIKKAGYPITAKVFKAIVGVFGGWFWDNSKTNK